MQTKRPQNTASGRQAQSGAGSFFADMLEGIRKRNARRKRRKALLKQKIAQLTPKQLKKYKAIKREKRVRRICRVLLCIFTALALTLVAVFAGCYVLFKGPSRHFGDLLTVSLLETSALKFVPRMYYSEKTMNEIIARNSVELPEEDTDTSLIVINEEAVQDESAGEPIELHEVNGPTFRGYMMIVKDPSRVSVGVCRDPFIKSQRGLELCDIADKYGAVAAINGGGFPDSGGVGKGGSPNGLTISNGKVMYKHSGGSESVTVGFDQNNKLIVGKMSATTAQKKGIRDCVTFGPALVLNGEPVKVSGSGSGLNPRTAIGQRADGAVLMLVIDGRQANSIGASISDLIGVMMEYGAINACNLDGGSSSMLYYNGAYVNKGVVLTGSRTIPTAVIVK